MEKKFKIILIILCFILIVSSGLLLSFFVKPSLTLEGENLTLELGVHPEEPGYHARFLGKDITNKVQVTNNIQYDQIGTYKITYKIDYFHRTTTKIRKVTIVDLEKPTIRLKGQEKVAICPNQTYQEEGYEAFDNYDGDLTDKVIVHQDGNSFIYTVQDKSNNQVQITRNISKEDKTNPLLTLTGNSTLYLTVGATYKEPGYQASDNCDGDLTEEVKITGTVNTKKVGSYTLTYTVKDQAGNETKKTRIIKVTEPNKGGTIYLTFDDGPSTSVTAKILDILKEENVKATFFVINHSDSLNSLIKREFDEGHTVALHSYTHNYQKVYASEQAYFKDLTLIRNKVYKITGVYSNLIRFPGGSSNTVSRFNPKIMTRLVKQVEEKGYTYFDWNVSSGDAGGAKTKQDVYNNVTSTLKSGTNIVLMHDYEGNTKTLNALKDIIQYAKNHGFHFEKITEATKPVHHGVNN